MSLTYFLRSLAHTPRGGALAMRLGRLLFFWLKHFDRRLTTRPTAIDAAAGTFFLGRRRSEPIGDERIIAAYFGARSAPAPGDLSAGHS
jgi:hypothetical protein